MSADQKLLPFLPKPGIKRDGTQFEGNNYVDGQWVRWQRGLPRKIGGYRQITDSFAGPVRGSYIYVNNGVANIYGGSSTGIEVIAVDANTGFGAGIVSRTPGGFTTNSDYQWMFTGIYDSVSAASTVIAHPGINLSNIDNETPSPIYYGDADATTALTSTGKSVSGGIAVLHPYVFGYGADGEVSWTVPNKPADWAGSGSGTARISARKLVKCLPYRGGRTNSPAGVFWSLDALIVGSFQGGATVFQFDTISDNISVLSSNAIVEYDGIYFWPSLNRFMMFNGVVREVPNNMNLNYFFDNLNYSQRQKVWGMAIPRWGEIWWFYPRGNATECTDAIILNVRENVWYDTSCARSSGISSNVFRWPVMFGTAPNGASKYQMWQHEYGVDEVVNSTVNAVPSYFESSDISLMANSVGDQWTGVDRWFWLNRLELDFVQTGDMTVTVRGRDYARGTNVDNVYTFSSTDKFVNIGEQRRQMRLRFETNVAGGDYQMGQNVLDVKPGDGAQ